MHACLLNVLHDPTDVQLGPVEDRIDVNFDGRLEETVDEQWRLRQVHLTSGYGVVQLGQIAPELVPGIDDPHRPATEHVRWAHQHRKPDRVGNLHRLGDRGGRPVSGLWDPQPATQRGEALPILRGIDGVWRGSCNHETGLLDGMCQTEWGLASELDDHGLRLFHHQDCQHVLDGEGLEIQAARRVVVRRNRLRVAVDHHRFVAGV